MVVSVDLQRTYHLGVRVPDIDAAMAEMGSSLGLRWCDLQTREQSVWTPSTGLTTVPLRFTYSADGPLHIELLEGAPGSVWDGREFPGAHHIGVWCDDVAATTAAMVAQGYTVTASQKAPDAGYGSFSYVQPPSGLIVELVNSAIEPMFQRWFDGGPLG